MHFPWENMSGFYGATDLDHPGFLGLDGDNVGHATRAPFRDAHGDFCIHLFLGSHWGRL